MFESLKGLANGLYICALLALLVGVSLLLAEVDFGKDVLLIAIFMMVISMFSALIAILNKK